MDPVTAFSRHRFGNFELQPGERRLLEGGAPVTLGPRAFDVLVALVESGGHLVTREQLLRRVWPGVIVEENTVQAQVSALRKVLGRNAIATVSRHGYRFTLTLDRLQDPAPQPAVVANNLPHPFTSLIGREKDVSHLVQLLGTARLLTLTGTGGCGKTRLGIEVAGGVLERHADGVWFVELASLTDPGLVAQTANSVLSVKVAPGKTETQCLISHLASRQALLVLDNAEHLLGGCAELVDALLRSCRGVSIMVTSREALGLNGEQTYRVPSLTVPSPGENFAPDALLAYEGVHLFVERARLLRPDFKVTSENAASLASICYRLDGIPLAIELAAPRLRSMSVEELNQGLEQRFALLTDGSRTALPRHRTLRSMLDWSYDLLRDPEKLFLQRLSVFAGGWMLPAAEEVCAGEGIEQRDVFDLLTSLADKSLVVPEQEDAQTRWRLLETVRQYARDRLEDSGGSAKVRVRHRDYYLALAEEAGPKLAGAGQAEWLRRLEEEHDNLRAGLEWSLVEAGSKGGLRLCGALQRFWWTRGYFAEGRQWCTRVLGKAGAEERTRERAYVLNAAGVLAYYQGDYPAARALHEEGLAISRELGDRLGMARSLGNLGTVACYQGDYPAGRALYGEGLAIRRELGDRFGIARSVNNLANVAFEQGDYPAARALYEDSLAIYRELGDPFGIATALSNLGYLALNQGDYPAASALLEESLAIRRELGDRPGIPQSLEGLAAVVASLRDSLTAARIWGATERLRAEIGTPLPPNERSGYDRRVTAARIASGDDAAFDSAWQEGRSLTLDQAIDLAQAKPVEGG